MTDSEHEWYLRHCDGVEHGPFRYADIAAAAKVGNIAEDTCVRHEEKTLGQWVYAQRVQTIADVINESNPQQAAKHPAQKPTPQKKTRVAQSPQRQSPQRQSPQRQSPQRAAASPAKAVAAPRGDSKTGASEAGISETDAPQSSRSLVEALPVVRPLREQGYPVPKTFLNACLACLAFVDFRFRCFVTPWIIKILWALCFTVAILWAGKLTYEDFVQSEGPTTSAAPAMGPAGDWQFEPLGDQPFLQSRVFRFVVTVGGMFVGVLCIRVLCEGAIVLLRAATDLNELRLETKESNRRNTSDEHER